MILVYNTEPTAAIERIKSAENRTEYDSIYLGWFEINNRYYIDARGEESKNWYGAELEQADEVLNELPQIDLS